MSWIAYAIAGLLTFGAAIVWGAHRFGHHDGDKDGHQ